MYLLKNCNEVATARTFDLSYDTLAVLKGGMRIHYNGADSKRDRGCTELLPPPPPVVVFDWNKQAESALPQLRVLSHVSVIISGHSDWTIRSIRIWLDSRGCWNVPWIIDLVRSLIFPHELRVRRVTAAPFGLD